MNPHSGETGVRLGMVEPRTPDTILPTDSPHHFELAHRIRRGCLICTRIHRSRQGVMQLPRLITPNGDELIDANPSICEECLAELVLRAIVNGSTGSPYSKPMRELRNLFREGTTVEWEWVQLEWKDFAETIVGTPHTLSPVEVDELVQARKDKKEERKARLYAESRLRGANSRIESLERKLERQKELRRERDARHKEQRKAKVSDPYIKLAKLDILAEEGATEAERENARLRASELRGRLMGNAA